MEHHIIHAMIDDTQGPEDGSQPFRAEISSEIENIMKYQVVRAHAEHWSRNLRFLTFDDSNEDDDGATSNKNENENEEHDAAKPLKGQCQRCELRIPISSGHRCDSHSRSGPKEEREIALAEYSNPCVHVNELTCSECQHIPLFPNKGVVNRFKIRRLGHYSGERCRHFVAVSYCWAGQDPNTASSTQEPYKVVEENGTVRDIRAARPTIDRIVEFARQNGYRMIWIDQECIEQDKPEEKALAVQAMDLVYLKAHASIALLQARLQQKHLDALMLVYEANFGMQHRKRGRSAFWGCRKLDLHTLTEAFSDIANDKWNTRAWVLQEAFVSSGNMMLLFPRTPDVKTAGWTLLCHEMSLTEFVIRLDFFVQCIRFSLGHIVPILRKQIAAVEDPKNSQVSESDVSSSSRELKKTLDRINLFHPEQPDSAHTFRIHMNDAMQQRACNAAVALTYLRLRDCFFVADKLAIVANMCGYPLRLNTVELQTRQKNLGTCMIALSLANGDFSLITPEFYRSMPVISEPPSIGSNSITEFSWNYGFNTRLNQVHSVSWNPDGFGTARGSGTLIGLSKSGLSLVGTVWKVDRFIELPKLQQKYSQSWFSLNKRLSKTPLRTFQLATTHLLFEIICALVSRGEGQTADAVFNSTSNFRWNMDKNGDNGVESVSEFPPELSIENRRGMFPLDRSSDGRYHQCWIIDRVMEKGGFWAGKIEDAIGFQIDYQQEGNSEVDVSRAENVSLTPRDIKSDDEESSLIAHERNGPRGPRSHRSQLKTSWMIATMSSVLNSDRLGQNKEEKDIVSQVMMTQGELLAAFSMQVSSPESARSRMERRAVFDIDGDVSGSCLVFTPFNMVMETIPRPEIRSMSVSWQVQRVFDANEKAESERPGTKLRTVKSVKGMWRHNLMVDGRYLLV